MDMVERVARAICWKNGMDPDLTLGGDGQNFLWHEYTGQAIAAIEAMREPDDAMKDAGMDAIDHLDAWALMIDSILKSTRETT